MDLVLAIERMGGWESVSDHGVLSTQFTGVAAVTVRIRAYNANGEISTTKDPLILGTRIFLACDVTELPEGRGEQVQVVPKLHRRHSRGV